MATVLESGLVAIFLEQVERDAPPPPGSVVLYTAEPIITAGRRATLDELSKEARRSVAPSYTVGGADGRTCEASMESIAVVHRRPSDDPTASREPSEKPDAFAARMFDSGREGKSYVVLARTERSQRCGAVWSVPRGAPIPETLARRPVAAQDRPKVAAALEKKEDYAMVAASAGPKAKPTIDSWVAGAALVWANASTRGPGADASACFVLAPTDKAYAVKASVSTCPHAPVTVTRGAGGTVDVWFAHAHAHAAGDRPEVTYWPTLLTGPTGGI